MLEAIGAACAATKAPLMTCLTNIPIMLMTLAEGAVQTRWGSGGMLLAETAAGFGAVLLFIPYAALVRMRVSPA
jgi:hypothetical protein